VEPPDIPGAVLGEQKFTTATFDQAHGISARSELVQRLAAEAYGVDYPAEVQPWGMTTWWTLGRCVSGLRVGPPHSFIDLACGRGGAGLWLARATGAKLTGVDWSPVAVASARARADAFVPSGADFLVGDMANTGLPDGNADAVLCLDAIFFAPNRVTALAEVRRLLRAGGRFVFTAHEVSRPTKPSDIPDWAPLIAAAGLTGETKERVPRFAEQLGHMYRLWLDNEDALRADIGEAAAADLLEEARTVGPLLAGREYFVFIARKPGHS
jgi:ubiquinone/menaquinone biosynthesis C-methylase UbiE